MNEEEQFVNIDLNDDNICSVCKLGTDRETLSFCHVCFELNIEGIPKSNLLHTTSLRGHKDCFEKYHLIANQDCPRSKLSKNTYYEDVKAILMNLMTPGEVKQLNAKLQQRIQEVFEELTRQVQEKDSLASELHVRHVAIEQLLKNYSKLPCLQVGRTGMKSHLT
ncbi:Protein EURL like protein [Myotis brandtii]|uniref:Protein EURL like protein n=1 Tax=Myotis brandtii TaxID=109478 RepID=S7Q1G5_MYOBR|nr:Protein EURL like protein [Myotis brandtii]